MIAERAPAKLNLILQVGPRRADGLHEICSLFASLELCDQLLVEQSDREDEVISPGVSGENLALVALRRFREVAPLPPLRVAVEKRIPVAAGLGGGSADAAAVLRVANRVAGDPLTSAELRTLGATIGADVPSQVDPRHALVTGAGESVEPLGLPEMYFVLIPSAEGLSTGEVYAEADRVGSTRAQIDPVSVRAAAEGPPARLGRSLENDLAAAALSLRPDLTSALDALRAADALGAQVTGSGPTVFGLFESRAAAEAAAPALPGAVVTGLRAKE